MPCWQHGPLTADSAAALRKLIIAASILFLLGSALARKHELTAEGVEGTQRPKVAVDCHQRGPVHLCRIHNFLYKARSIPETETQKRSRRHPLSLLKDLQQRAHNHPHHQVLHHDQTDTIQGTRWELGMALPFFYSPNHDDTELDITSINSSITAAPGGAESLFLPGPCTVNNAPAWGCPSNAVRIFRSPPEERTRICSQALQYRDPVVLVYRNFPNVMHWLSDQVIPYFFAIDEFGMANETIQIMTLDEIGYHHNFRKIAMMDAVWQKLSGNPVADMAEHVRENICAPAAILGGAAHALTQYNIPLPYSEVRRDAPRYQRFAPWMLGKFDLSHPPAIPDPKRPRLLMIDRSAEPTRSIVNQDEFVRIASELTSARLVKFEELNFADQLRLVSESDILIGVHGAGLAMGAFLPPWGVLVELLPYAYGSANRDFYMGMCGWHKLHGIQYLGWHNRDFALTKQAGPDPMYFKAFHTTIAPDTASWIVQSAMDLAALAPKHQVIKECMYLNEPAQHYYT